MQPVILYDFFSTSECDLIIELARSHSAGKTADVASNRADYRSSNLLLLPSTGATQSVGEKLVRAMHRINEVYNFDLSKALEPLHCVKYEVGGFFKWHQDSGNQKIDRKISISVQLSDHSDYEGGDLEFSGLREMQLIKRRGNVIAFPSYLTHRVTPVTKGTRYALIAWALGPRFR
jgi:PKHD-type hydroxylase